MHLVNVTTYRMAILDELRDYLVARAADEVRFPMENAPRDTGKAVQRIGVLQSLKCREMRGFAPYQLSRNSESTAPEGNFSRKSRPRLDRIPKFGRRQTETGFELHWSRPDAVPVYLSAHRFSE